MRMVRWGGVVLLVLLLVGIWAAPLGPVPGFFIGGTRTPTPAVWPDTSDVHEIRLRVPGTLPRVVIIWVVEHAGDLYVVGSASSGWVQQLGAGGPVDLRLGDATYALRAVPVRTGVEAIYQAYVTKYQPDYPEIIAGFPSAEVAATSAAIFRLERA